MSYDHVGLTHAHLNHYRVSLSNCHTGCMSKKLLEHKAKQQYFPSCSNNFRKVEIVCLSIPKLRSHTFVAIYL